MTIEELEIIIKANIKDAISGIKQITDEVKSAVNKSIEPMKKMTTQAKEMANKGASSVSKIKSQMQEYNNSIKETAKQQEYLKAKIQESQDKIKNLKSESKDFLEWENAFENNVGHSLRSVVDNSELLKEQANLENLQKQLDKLEQTKPKVEPEIDDDKPKEKVKSLWDYIKDFARGVINGLKEAGKLAGQGFIKGIQLAINGIKNIVQRVINVFKGISSNSKNIEKNIVNSFNSGIKSIKKFAMGLLGIRTAFSAIRKATSAYLSYNTQLSDSLQNCWNVLGSLLAPILERLVGIFSTLVSYVNAFVKALSGIDLVARANAKSLNSQAKATKNASKQLSSLDDLNNLSSDNGSGDNGNKPITVEDVKIDDLANKFINYDWYSIGMEVGHKINDALSKISWDFIQNMAISLSVGLGNMLNGLVDGVDWTLLGNTIGNGIQTALLIAYNFMTTFDWQKFGQSVANGLNSTFQTIDFKLLGQTFASKWVAMIDWLYGFVNTFDWSEFGKSIADAVMGWFNAIDWGKAGETLSDGIRGLFTSIKEFIANIDWEQLGNDIWVFVSSIDWTGMISDLAFILGEAIAGIGKLLWGFIKEAVKSIADFFSEKFEEAGGDIVQGLLLGIVEAMENILIWLWNNVVAPIIDGFKNMFGIHSPSTVMAELGGYLIQGLFNGLVGIWDKVKEIFENLKTNISNKFSEILNKIKSIFSIDSIKSHFNQVVTAIKNVFSSIPNWFKDKFTQAWTNVKNVFSSGGKIFDGIKEGIATTFKNIVNKLISGINKIIAIPFDKINSMLNKIRNTSFLGVEPFKGLWSQNPLKVPVIPSLANGGVLTEETLVRVAEYSNAKSNPEIVSPVELMDSTFRNALKSTDFGTRIDRLTIKYLDENVYDGAIEYINEQSRLKGVSVIKEVG